MLAFWIIEKLDVIEDICTSLLTGCIGFTPYAFSLEELEEALCHGIIITVSSAAHASFQIVCFEERLPLITGKLRPLISMNNNP